MASIRRPAAAAAAAAGWGLLYTVLHTQCLGCLHGRHAGSRCHGSLLLLIQRAMPQVEAGLLLGGSPAASRTAK